MPLKPATMLGQYEILALIGVGGMGEVYRANDTELKRDVALKVLPEAFARDPDRVARFRREAQLLASLNHPNIAAIYGLGESGGLHFLVLELVEGDTLRDRIARDGALPVEESLAIGKQITEALECAHDKAIIHRDLKPANVKLTPEGQVKVLDFGLAKAFAGDSDVLDSHSPTLSASPTIPGAILGTPAYMSPEQAKGKQVDRRTDIWAFGCVLYELLTGQGAFHRNPSRAHPSRAHPSRARQQAVASPAMSQPLPHGRGSDEPDTVQDILARVLQAEPDWTALPETTPHGIRVLLRRCLHKDAAKRFHSAADVAIQIEEAVSAPAPAPPTTPTPARPAWQKGMPWGIAFFAGVVIASVAWNLRPSSASTPPSVTRFAVSLPQNERLTLRSAAEACPTVALSPDGRLLAYVAVSEGREQLYLRAMDSLEGRAVSGAEGVVDSLFFSPDGQWLGFWVNNQLKKVSTSAGAPVTLASTNACGGSWGSDDTIIFGLTNALSRVSAAGGTPQTLSAPDVTKGESGYAFPEFLPGGRALLFTIRTSNSTWDDAQIVAQRLDTGERKVLVQGGSQARYVPTGHLVYARAGTLLAVPFDLRRLEVTGGPVALVEGVIRSGAGASKFGVSHSGTLVYVPGGIQEAQGTLVWVDRKGAAQPLLGAPPRAYGHPRLSPDGQQLAVTIAGTKNDVWVYDLPRGTLTRLTFEGANQLPLWTPDGKRIAFRSDKAGPQNLFWKPADGSGAEEQITKSERFSSPSSISPDGKLAFYTENHPTNGRDLWMVPLEGERKASLFLQTQFNEVVPKISPDARWIAYLSDESGRYEVYVRPFSGPVGKWQISTEGGTEPLWARNGRELFYRAGGKVMAVDIRTEPTFAAGTPRLLFEGRYAIRGTIPETNFDVSPDGQRFLMIKESEQAQPATQINVVLNWFEELRRRVPAAK